MNCSNKALTDLLLHQLRNYWTDIDEDCIASAVDSAMEMIEKNYKGLPNRRYFNDGQVVFSPYISVQWMNFLYRVSRAIYLKNGYCDSADQVYYLNKIMHSVDWFYAIDLPEHFLCEHPLGTILGRAEYSDHLFVYQGVTVGGNRKNGELQYPKIGENVMLYANATVLGDTRIGNNVIVSADTYLINAEIPDNCIVFGHSPDITIVNKSETQIKEYTDYIWGWKK
ncbi:MAG: transferase [Clostridiales bacterium]|nr:transferase [Clostridiales bacterium]MBP5417622.1 transferase [Clostridiales bacterium]